ncbi:MAG: ACP phosphodiesterase [Flavobacteriales bacterium]
MNCLAHIYLSGDSTEILLGNFMGDDIKGKNYLNYPNAVQKGILLHRLIDTETDSHPDTKSVKQLLRSEFGIFSGIITDIFFDYFLAKNWNAFHSENLKEYAQQKYRILNENKYMLPKKTAFMLTYMMKNDWLYSYRLEAGIERALSGMGQRISSRPKLETAMPLLVAHHSEIQERFQSVISHLQSICFDYLTQETTN